MKALGFYIRKADTVEHTFSPKPTVFMTSVVRHPSLRKAVAITVISLFALFLCQGGQARAALACTPTLETVNIGEFNVGPQVNAYQRAECTGGTAGDIVTVCVMFVNNSGGRSGTGQPFYMKKATDTMGFFVRKLGSNLSTGTWYSATATLNASGSATPFYSFTVLADYTGQTLPAGTYTSDFNIRVRAGSRSVVGTDCSGAGVYDGNIIKRFTAYSNSGCTVTNGTMNFGNVSTLTTSVDATATFMTQCTNGLAYTVSLDGGQNGGTSATNRRMRSGSNYVTYGLYTDSARSVGWYGPSAAKSGTGNATSQTIYGRVPAQVTPPPATYTDNVVITLTY